MENSSNFIKYKIYDKAWPRFEEGELIKTLLLLKRHECSLKTELFGSHLFFLS